ncbi:MAG: tRNA pseudouridine(38-40) synthase TruA [Bacteroidales bacterium]
MLQRYFLWCSFNGASFYGWQRQPQQYTVQQCLEEHFSVVLRQKISLVGAGRTDTGVHAKNFAAHLQMDLNGWNPKELVHRMNRFLPQAIVIHDIIPVNKQAHARFDAISRTYHYYIALEKDPFADHLSYYFHGKPQIAEMNKACRFITGMHDFTSFSKTGMDVKTFNCYVKEAVWFRKAHFLVFRITADRFLRNMVRSITGTLLDAGRGYISAQDILTVLESRDRQRAGNSLPAKGLFFTGVKYPPEIFVR